MTDAINRTFARTPADVVQRAAHFASSVLADVAGRRGGMHGRIRCLTPSLRLAGPALTVEVRPGDNLMIHAALALAQPGDVLVVDGKGDLSCALVGDILSRQALALGVAGLVVDGAVRDIEGIQALGLPVFAAGLNPNGPSKHVPGRLNHPVTVGGIVVQPGDLIVGDADGVAVIPRADAAALLPLAEKKLQDEAKRVAEIDNRQALRAPWLEASLRAAGLLREGQAL
jgi:4-hydroxy-4-methyl-2-oxoglutarate aldolase